MLHGYPTAARKLFRAFTAAKTASKRPNTIAALAAAALASGAKRDSHLESDGAPLDSGSGGAPLRGMSIASTANGGRGPSGETEVTGGKGGAGGALSLPSEVAVTGLDGITVTAGGGDPLKLRGGSGEAADGRGGGGILAINENIDGTLNGEPAEGVENSWENPFQAPGADGGEHDEEANDSPSRRTSLHRRVSQAGLEVMAETLRNRGHAWLWLYVVEPTLFGKPCPDCIRG